MTRKTGTKEWASSSVNIQTGCSHGCLYCYASAMAARFGRRAPGDWTREELQIPPKVGKRKGRIMFPTTHDITPDNVDVCALMIKRMLDAGNDVLVVSKPHLDVVLRLLLQLGTPTQELTFRFTIGAWDPEALRFWEPGAPSLDERRASLRETWDAGWQTSVSIEPALDSVNGICELVRWALPYVTDTIWIGLMNNAPARLKLNGQWTPEVEERLGALVLGRGDVGLLHRLLGGIPKVRWKDSIKAMLGLAEEEIG